MSKLHISDTLLLPPETVTSTSIVYGGKGMGKTNFGAVLAEEFSRLGLRYCVLDPMGVWWGLRHSADGKGPGVQCLILGGPHGDIPIEPTGGTVVADLVVDEDANVIIDFSRKANGEAWSIGEKVRFVRDFGRQLHRRQSGLVSGRRREPICVILDEAARFIPQTIFRSGDRESPEAECLSVWATITEEGRNFGLGVVFLTQRSARLNKAVAELADLMVAFRTVGPNSIDAIIDWLGEHVPKNEIKRHVESLRSLPRGDALFVSPGWLQFEGVVHVRLRSTFDSSATPKPGERARRVTGKAAKPDLAKYAARMQETIERAKENDPAELKKRVRALQQELEKREAKPETENKKELRRELAAATKRERAAATALGEIMKILARVTAIGFEDTAITPEDVKAAMEAAAKQIGALAKKKIQQRATELESIKKQISQLRSRVDGLLKSAEDESIKVEVAVERKPTLPGERLSNALTVTSTPRQHRPRAGSNGTGDTGDIKLASGARRMLAACLTWAPKGLTEAQVAAQAGVKRTGGTFGTYKSSLVAGGLLRIDNGLLYATDEGIEYAGGSVPPAPTTTDEVKEIWKPKLASGAQRMLDYLIERGGDPVTADELAQASGVSNNGGTFGTYLSQLSTADLITRPERGMVAANRETLFL